MKYFEDFLIDIWPVILTAVLVLVIADWLR